MSGFTTKRVRNGRRGTKTNQPGLNMQGNPASIGRPNYLKRAINRRVHTTWGLCGFGNLGFRCRYEVDPKTAGPEALKKYCIYEKTATRNQMCLHEAHPNEAMAGGVGRKNVPRLGCKGTCDAKIVGDYIPPNHPLRGPNTPPSLFGLNLSTTCNCSFNLWCEYPALTNITGNGISTVDPLSIVNYIKNIISFVNSFNTDSIVIRLQAPKIQLDWTIQDEAQMYEMLAGVNATGGPGLGGSLTGIHKERTFPFYSLEDITDNSTIGYLINQLKTVINPNIKIYLLPYVGFDAGYGGPFNFVTALSPSTTIPSYSVSSDDNQNAVDSFWCAVHFYNWYDTYSKRIDKISHGFDGVIIETEDSQLDAPPVPNLPDAQAQIKATYSLFNTSPQVPLVTAGVRNYASSTPGNTSIDFGLTGSPTISKTINQINTVSIINGQESNKINITTLWPQYYNLQTNPIYEVQAYGNNGNGPFNKNTVVDYINTIYQYLTPSDNDTTAEVMGMLSIETNAIRKYTSTGVVGFGQRTPFFGQNGWKWDDVCYVGNNAIKNKKLKNGPTLKPTIFSGADLYTDLGKFTAETISNITINNNFNTSSC